MLRWAVVFFLFLQLSNGQICNTSPCENGECIEETDSKRGYKCTCPKGWAGLHCNLPQPEVICGEKTIEIFIDDRIVTEQGLPSDAQFVHFLNSASCYATKRSGSYYLKVDAPFKDCDVQTQHDGDDYVFSQQIVWNKVLETVERPLILLDFKCTYEDKYSVSTGDITPFSPKVELKTSYGTFHVGMALYRSRNFAASSRYGARPVFSSDDDVCVSTELKNVKPRDLVLTNRECWASTNSDGTGDSHGLVASKCQNDPTTQMLSNGQGDAARFCFKVFRWKDTMNELYMHCVVSVCNATAGEEYCQCETNRTRRFVRSVTENSTEAVLTYGPIFLKPKSRDYELPSGDADLNNRMYGNPKSVKPHKKDLNSRTALLVSVGVIIMVSLVLLGVAVAAYVHCRRRSDDAKETLRNEGEHVVIPDPVTVDSIVDE